METILKENAELLKDLDFDWDDARETDDDPLLESIIISKDYDIDISKLPDDASSLKAIHSAIDTVRRFLEAFVGLEEAEDRITGGVDVFLNKNRGISLAGLGPMFTDLAAPSSDEALEEIDHMGPHEQLEHFFKEALKACFNEMEADLDALLSKLNDSKHIEEATFNGKDIFLRFDRDSALSDIAKDVSECIDDIYKKPHGLVGKVVERYRPMLEKHSVMDVLFEGAFSSRMSTGLNSLDEALKGGLMRDFGYLVTGPAGQEIEALGLLFLKKGLEMGGCAIAVITNMFPSKFKNIMGRIGIDLDSYYKKNKFRLIDMYTYREERVVSVSKTDDGFVCTGDLTNLDIAFSKSMKELDFEKGMDGRIVMFNVLDTTTMHNDMETVYDFTASTNAKLNSKGYTVLSLINKYMLSLKEASTIEELFDGIIEVKRERRGSNIKRKIRIVSTVDGMFDREPLSMKYERNNIQFIRDSSQTIDNISLGEFGGSRITYGTRGLDLVVHDGIPKGHVILVQVPSESERRQIRETMSSDAIKNNHSLFVILALYSPKDLLNYLNSKKIRTELLMDRNKLSIVDWFSFKEENIIGVDVQDHIIKCSQDLTYLGIGVDTGLRSINHEGGIFAIIDMVSSALQSFEMDRVYSFLETLTTKLDKYNSTTVIFIGKEEHDPRTIATIQNLADTILDFRKVDGRLYLAPLTSRGSYISERYRGVISTSSGFALDQDARDKESLVPESISTDADSLKMELDVTRKLLEKIMAEKSGLEERVRSLRGNMGSMDTEKKKDRALLDALENGTKKTTEKLSDVKDSALSMKELSKILYVLDDLLEQLPDDVIEKFAKSDNFKLYEKIMDALDEDS